MNELDKLHSCKRMIDKLADGINPLTGSPHPDESVFNNVDLTRCFFHVSQIVDRVLQNGGEIGFRRRRELKPFVFNDDKKEQISLSDKPVSVTGLVSMINTAVAEPGMRRLTATQITAWLEQSGFLTTVLNAEGKNQRVPTDSAPLIGITQVERKNAAGSPFMMNLYNAEAQQFILDNMDSILAANPS